MTNKAFITSLFLFIGISSFTQNNTEQFSILFYNVENLFDTRDDPDTNDDEYAVNGDRYWSQKKLNQKTQNLSKVLLSAAGWNLPAIIGLCEVENRYVLDKLLDETPLKSASFKIIHKESPDHRGTEVALLYNSNQFYPLRYKYYPLRDGQNKVKDTREILYVSGVLAETDTLHIFINHWPSRYSGLMETKPDRNLAARILREQIGEVMRLNGNAKIIILGDFNDQPQDESIRDVLGAREAENRFEDGMIYNLSFNWNNEGRGTLKYQSKWYVFDQIIVSGTLLNSTNGFFTKPEYASVVTPSFLLEKDEKYGGKKPKRTYYGYQYQGGFSDHLPVMLRLEKVN